jgi:transcriptional regulator NrdR family protein
MGMVCPKCGGKAKCNNTKQRLGPSVTRHYKCPDCECRFSTCELMVTIDGAPAPRTKRYGTATSLVERLEVQVLGRASL